MTTGLPHLSADDIGSSALQTLCNEFSVGPLSIRSCIDTTVPEATISVRLFGVRIGGGTIDENSSTLTVGGGVAGYKAEVTIEGHFSAQRIEYAIELCVPIQGCRDYRGILISW